MKYILGLSDSETVINLVNFIKLSHNLNNVNIVLPFNNLSKEFNQKLKRNSINFNRFNFIYIFENLNEIKKIIETTNTFNDINEYIINKIDHLKNLENFIYLSTSIDPINSDIIANNINLVFKDIKIYNTQNYSDIINKVFLLNIIEKSFYYQVSNYPLKVFDFFYILKDNTNILQKTNSLVFNVFDISMLSKNYNLNDFVILDLSNIYKIFSNNFIVIKKELKEKIHIDYLWGLMIKLRYNCLWDKKQTSLSIKNHLLEEAYEVFDSIDNPDKFKEELGDLLLQIIFHSQIKYDEKNFSFIDVIESLINKLIYRHPHIFENLEIKDVSDLLKNWEKLKNKKQKNKKYIDLPKKLPSLFKLLLIFRKFKRTNNLDSLINLINAEIDNFLNNYFKNENKNNTIIHNIKQIINLLINITSSDLNLEEILNKFLNKIIDEINKNEINKKANNKNKNLKNLTKL
jgi:tetrapyrrole methylase family protein/MazG family protein